MAEPEQRKHSGAARIAAAFSVHVFTAAGAALALLALLAAVERRWTLMFAWLIAALAVDGVDGLLARRFEVRTTLPRWSGDTLDLVVDILTWVFVPAYAIVAGGLLPGPLAVPLGIAIMMTSALYFADTRMKSADNFFYGFPGAWNVVAFLLHLLRPDPWLAAVAVAALCVLTFVPAPFVHPFRVKQGRAVTIGLLVLGAILVAIALVRDLEPGPFVTVPLCAITLYFLAAGLWRGRIQRLS